MAAKFGACERVVYHLRRSNLLDRGRLDQVLDDFMQTEPQPEPARSGSQGLCIVRGPAGSMQKKGAGAYGRPLSNNWITNR